MPSFADAVVDQIIGAFFPLKTTSHLASEGFLRQNKLIGISLFQAVDPGWRGNFNVFFTLGGQGPNATRGRFGRETTRRLTRFSRLHQRPIMIEQLPVVASRCEVRRGERWGATAAERFIRSYLAASSRRQRGVSRAPISSHGAAC